LSVRLRSTPTSAGVSAVLDHHPGGDDIDDAELFGDGRTISSPDVETTTMSRPAARCSPIRAAASAYTYGLIKLFESLVDDLGHLLDPPAPTQLGHMIADLRHLLLVSAAETEHELGVRRLHHVAARDQAIPVERTAERQGWTWR